MAIRIFNMCGNGGNGGGSGESGPVLSWCGIFPDANGNINATADNLGAALAALNVCSVTKQYRRYIAIEGNEEVTPQQFIWSRGKGSWFLRADDGLYFVSCVDVIPGLNARVYIHIPAITDAEGDILSGGIYLNSTALANFSSTEDLQQLILLLGNSPIATEQYVSDVLEAYITSEDLTAALQNYITENGLNERLSGYVTATQLTNALKGKVTPAGAHNIAKYEINRMLPLTAVGSTYLEKVKENGKTMIKIVFGCQDWLYNNWNTFESVKLQLLICHRRHGLKYRWRHPLNWNEESADPESNRYGYGSIVGMERDPQHYPGEEFPSVPRWMQHGGYMETSITLKREDAKRGFYMIDPSLYFLPMLKPADCSKAFGSNNLEFMGCQPRSNTARRHLPAMVTWSVEVDGYPLGKPMNTLRVGCFRLADRTRIVNNYYAQPGRAYVSGLYLKID